MAEPVVVPDDVTDPATHVVRLPSGHLAYVSADDAELVGRYTWFATAVPRHGGAKRYVAGRLRVRNVGSGHGGPLLRMHRLIMDVVDVSWRHVQVDHINRNGFDNRRSNLRLCTPSQQMGNTGLYRTNRSGYRGVSWDSRDLRWLARIRVGGDRKLHLGSFRDPWEAALAWNAAALEHFGSDFAQLNIRKSGAS